MSVEERYFRINLFIFHSLLLVEVKLFKNLRTQVYTCIYIYICTCSGMCTWKKSFEEEQRYQHGLSLQFSTVLGCFSFIDLICQWPPWCFYLWLAKGKHQSFPQYCDPSTFLLRKFQGHYLAGFVAVHAISDPIFDVEGYVGFDTVDRAIYIV